MDMQQYPMLDGLPEEYFSGVLCRSPWNTWAKWRTVNLQAAIDRLSKRGGQSELQTNGFNANRPVTVSGIGTHS